MSAKLRHAFQLREFIYPANLLTLARVLLLPAAIHYMRREDGRWRALGIFGGAMATDMLDGPVARMRREVSPLRRSHSHKRANSRGGPLACCWRAIWRFC